MKVLLVNPSRLYRRGGKSVRVGLPIGLMYISSVLEQAGHEVEIFDFLISKNARFEDIDDLSFRHGVPDGDFIEFLKKDRPDVVGIACPATPQSPETVRVLQLVRLAYPDVLVVVGGPHFSVAGEEFMKENPQADIAVSGEGEFAMREILDVIQNKGSLENVAGIFFRDKNRQIVITKSKDPIPSAQMDAFPLPAYHLVDMPTYFSLLEQGFGPRVRREKGSVSIITSRGCPYNCVFCSIHLHMGRQWRFHSSAYVLNHIDFLVKNYHVKHISFEDDNLTLDKKRFNEILDGLLERNYGVTWDTPNGIRAETLQDEDLVRKMKKSGCVELIMGVESGVQRVLDNIVTKNLNLSYVVSGAEVCKKVGIPLGAFLIIGFPGESREDIEGTIKFGLMLRKKYGVMPAVQFATPLVGTRLYKICKENNFFADQLTPESLATATSPLGRGLIKTEDFDPAYLKSKIESLNRRLFTIKFFEILFSPSKLIAVVRRRLGAFVGAQ